MTSPLSQVFLLFKSLNTLRQTLNAKMIGNSENILCHQHIFVVIIAHSDSINKALIYLKYIKGHILKKSQTGISCSEVIHRYLKALLLNLMKNLNKIIHIIKLSTLSYFKINKSVIYIVFIYDITQDIYKIRTYYLMS